MLRRPRGFRQCRAPSWVIDFRFDAAMFDKYNAIDNISTEYSLEKVELEDARKVLDEIETEKEFIIEKQLFL